MSKSSILGSRLQHVVWILHNVFSVSDLTRAAIHHLVAVADHDQLIMLLSSLVDCIFVTSTKV